MYYLLLSYKWLTTPSSSYLFRIQIDLFSLHSFSVQRTLQFTYISACLRGAVLRPGVFSAQAPETHSDTRVNQFLGSVVLLSEVLHQDAAKHECFITPCQETFDLPKGLRGAVSTVRGERSDAIRDCHASNALNEDRHTSANGSLFG